jgi:hypothetical protein
VSEAQRQRTVELIERLRKDPSVSPALWELLEIVVQRLERTEQRRYTSSGNFSAAKIGRILESGRTDEEKGGDDEK